MVQLDLVNTKIQYWTYDVSDNKNKTQDESKHTILMMYVP